ncbi:hypothetical protein [Neorhizobium sp. DAR64872/K0K18]|uniref:hypothetical protein n=1 Tax=Neorhizobium sp. DAR64872/K0K18 TaxID=3421958 RepID=UPI003D2E8EF9
MKRIAELICLLRPPFPASAVNFIGADAEASAQSLCRDATPDVSAATPAQLSSFLCSSQESSSVASATLEGFSHAKDFA